MLLCALRYYATGALYSILEDATLLSPSGISRSIREVTKALCRKAPDIIKWPGAEAQDALKERFYDIAGTMSCYYLMHADCSQYCPHIDC